MAKAAKVKVRVSTQPAVLMEAEVARKIRQHARSSMKAEVCGVLIGSSDPERMVVEACIQGNNAAQGGAHVTFTQDTWEHIYKIKDAEYPEQKIVGWYHSHPGFGVFLSEHDLFIQQNFFSNPQQVAWVYDPHTDEEGCFGWVGEKIEKLSSIRVGYSQNVEIIGAGTNDYENEEAFADPVVKVKNEGGRDEPAWVRWTSLALGYLAAIILGVSAGFFLGQWTAPANKKLEILDACQHIQWQSSICQEILVQLAPAQMTEPFVPQAPGAQPLQTPATQAQQPASAPEATNPSATAKENEKPAPSAPEKAASPQKKENNAKH
jgi:proteasome lid subunit RPN8/RPN11